MEMEKITPLRISELFPSGLDVTHLGEIGSVLERQCMCGEVQFDMRREGYTMHGVEWTLTDVRDGQQYTLVLVPRKS